MERLKRIAVDIVAEVVKEELSFAEYMELRERLYSDPAWMDLRSEEKIRIGDTLEGMLATLRLMLTWRPYEDGVLKKPGDVEDWDNVWGGELVWPSSGRIW